MLSGSDRQKSTQRLSFLPAKTHAFSEQHSRFGKDIDQSVLNHSRKPIPEWISNLGFLRKPVMYFFHAGKSVPNPQKGRHLKEGGYQTYELEFSVDGNQCGRFQSGPTSNFIRMWSLRRTPSKQIMLSAKQTFSKSVVMLIYAFQVCDRCKDILGKVASRAINPNEVIRKPPLPHSLW